MSITQNSLPGIPFISSKMELCLSWKVETGSLRDWERRVHNMENIGKYKTKAPRKITFYLTKEEQELYLMIPKGFAKFVHDAIAAKMKEVGK
jgi:hypothetical protein